MSHLHSLSEARHHQMTVKNEAHFILHLEVVLTNEQRLPQSFFDLNERWTYLQSFIYRIARCSTNQRLDHEQVVTFEEEKTQGSIIDYAIKIVRQ